MLMKSYLPLIALRILFTNNAISQDYPYKFGKVSLKEMQMEECSFSPKQTQWFLQEKDILNSIMITKMGLNTGVRKKIFDTEDSDEGNIKIHLYTPDNNSKKESISSFKAYG